MLIDIISLIAMAFCPEGALGIEMISLIGNLALDVSHNFENGRYWGNMNYYEFRYRSNEEKIFNSVLNFICCFIYPMFITGCILAILYKFKLTDSWGGEWYSIVMFCSFILGVIFAIRFCTKSKGVFIFDNCLEIDRYYITTFHWKPNIKINYNDIKNIYNSRKMIDRSSFNAMKGIVAGGDLSYYTEIILNNGKVFRVPVENQEMFVDNLIEKVNEYRRKTGLEEI